MSDLVRYFSLRDVAVALDRVRRDDFAPSGPPFAMTCTGLTALWCPNHGSCSCPVTNVGIGYRETMDDPLCPLHSPTSRHAEELTPRDSVESPYTALGGPQMDDTHYEWTTALIGGMATVEDAAKVLNDLDQDDWAIFSVSPKPEGATLVVARRPRVMKLRNITPQKLADVLGIAVRVSAGAEEGDDDVEVYEPNSINPSQWRSDFEVEVETAIGGFDFEAHGIGCVEALDPTERRAFLRALAQSTVAAVLGARISST